MRVLLVAIPVLLAGCSPSPDASTPQGRCEAQVYDDPTVKQLVEMSASNDAEAAQQAINHMDEAKKNATIRCLRGVGLAPRGSVERQKPPS